MSFAFTLAVFAAREVEEMNGSIRNENFIAHEIYDVLLCGCNTMACSGFHMSKIIQSGPREIDNVKTTNIKIMAMS